MPGFSSKHPARVRICRRIADAMEALRALEGNAVLRRSDCILYANLLSLYRSEIAESDDERECHAVKQAEALLNELGDFARDNAAYDSESPDAEFIEGILSQLS